MRWLGLLAALAIGPAATGQQRGGRALDAYQAELERLWVAIDFSDLEPEALAAQLGGDPAVLSRAVRERVRYEPYAGVLRGARGALLAGAGSSFDRAELLASLLRHGGRKVRMAWGRLTPAQAESLVRASLEVAPPARPGTPLREEVLSRAEDHFLLLGDALHAAGHRARPDPSAWAECVKDAAFHAWVQVEAGGVWIDVDPSAPEPVGRALAQPEGTAEAFDESLRHRGVLRLEVEKLVDGRSERQVVLEHAAPAADLAGVPLGFYHEIEPERAVPVLVAGDALVRGQAFPWAAPRGASAQAGALAGALGGEGEPSAPFVREWLSVTVVGPSGQRQALTPLSTEVGPGDRRAAAQAEEALETVHGVAVAVGGVPAALPLAILCGTANPLSEVGAVRLLAAKAFDYVAAREVLPASLVEPAPRSWVDRPNVIVASARAAEGGAGIELSLDLAFKSYRLVRTPEDPAAAESFFDGLSSGVLDHLVERAVLGAGLGFRSLGSLVEAAADRSVKLAVVEGKLPQGLPLSAEGKKIAAREVGAGRWLVLPAARPEGWRSPLGFWSVDPLTGWTEDWTEDGRHQAATDRAVQEKQTPSKARIVCVLALRITINVAIPLATQLAGLPPQIQEFLDQSKIDDALEKLGEGLCGGKGPIRKDNPVPGWKPFPPRPKNFPNKAPNPPRPAHRWPPGAPRGG